LAPLAQAFSAQPADVPVRSAAESPQAYLLGGAFRDVVGSADAISNQLKNARLR
jgi:hypothetical protein